MSRIILPTEDQPPINIAKHKGEFQNLNGPWVRRAESIGGGLWLAESAKGPTSRRWMPAIFNQCDPDDPFCFYDGWGQVAWTRNLQGYRKGLIEARMRIIDNAGQMGRYAEGIFDNVEDAVNFLLLLARGYRGADWP